MNPINLPFWLEGVELVKLRDAATAYWARIEAWIRWPLTQFDALTCSEGVLNLLAYQRDIRRFKDEPLDLFRKRVAFAYANAEDAGSKAGFIAIFQRLGIGALTIDERIPGLDWDIVHLQVSDQQLSTYQLLLNQIVVQYRRTCRRYSFVNSLALSLSIKMQDNGCVWGYDMAVQSDVLDHTNIIPAAISVQPFDRGWGMDTAKL
ncbi:MAG: hypothetical protein ACXWE9_00945 [Methylobacter sp.]